MSKEIAFEDKKAITPTFRVSFPHVFKAHAMDEDSDAKYSVVMLFDKDTDLKPLKKAMFMALLEKFGSKEKIPKKGWRSPFRDGDEDRADQDGYEGKIFVTANSTKPVGLVNQKREAIIDESEFYAGCYARASIVARWYEVKGNKGVAFSLLNVQKVADGEAFSGRRNAADEFDEIESDDDDYSNFDGESDDGYEF